MEKVLFNWSGGKDSSLCLYKLMQNSEYEICALLTSVNEENSRVSMHGIREKLLRNQAEKITLPLDFIKLPGKIDMETYNQIMMEKLIPYRERGVQYCVYGDIFLNDLRVYREKKLKNVNMKALFPLWQISTQKLAKEFIDLDFKAVITSVDGSKLDRSFVGREYDKGFLADLPDNVDPCGENGEFHTFVYDGPIFETTVLFKKGEIVEQTYESAKNETHSFSNDSSQQTTFIYWFIDLQP